MSATAAPGELREVRLLQFPLDVYQRANEAFEGLRREFTLIAMRTTDAQQVPKRLLQLVDALTGEYEALNEETDRVRDDAIDRGEKVLDQLVYRLPPSAAPACMALNQMLDEADQFCAEGELLLSLASPPEAVAFRRWFLGEIVAQLDGEPPLPWPRADIASLLSDARLRGGSHVVP